MRRTIPLLLLLALLPGCRSRGRVVVGLVPKGANHIFWQSVHAGGLKAAQEFDFELEWNAPTLEVDSSRQIEIVESMINRRLAGIALAPVDKKALIGVVERGTAQGIPMVIFDSGIDTDKRISYIATDNLEAGRMGARRMGEVLGGRGKVGIVGFMPGSASTMDRENGFKEEIEKNFPAIEIVALQFGMADRAKSMAITENMLTANPDLAGLFADNESSSIGAAQALKSRNNRQTKLVAFDANDQILADLKEGWIDSIVIQNPFGMGYEAVRALGLKLKGQTPPPVINSGAALAMRTNLETPQINEYLFPDLATYLKGQ